MIRQAIETRYLAPTNTKGARVVAVTGSGIREVYPWEHGLNQESNHVLAARALALSLDWIGENDKMFSGGTEKGFCHVIVDIAKEV